MNESKLKNSVLLRMLIIAGLSLGLVIPALFVLSLVDERQERRNAAMLEVSQSWGGSQTLTGPIVSIPFKEFTDDKKGNTTYTIRHAHFLPSKLIVRSRLTPEIRYRGIYQVALYTGRFSFEGEFDLLDLVPLGVDPRNVLWSDAFVTVGISDLKGVRDTVNLIWNRSILPSTAGVLSNDLVASGITFRPQVGLSPLPSTFSFSININGSSEITFVPIGKITEVSMESSWGDPSFLGGFLPATREIGPSSFRAEWKILSLNRNFPQSWTGSRYNLLESAFGARLFLPVDQYQKTSRTVKYALLFIALTFAALFLSEMLARTVLHPIQYALIGLALVLFYLLLLSLSEHLGFSLAYTLSAVAVIGLVSAYTGWITARKGITAVILFVLSLLYLFLYITLQLQDYALLIGTLGLLVTLVVIMYVTRRIDWFSLDAISRGR